ncbi:TPA: hypothetical protein UMV35_000888 [Stenotrophomonas maltophilia]|uniref:hypothetical protein n=1 Tax=Stenotrophomonas sp. GD03680 TaxID=2975365 RepID=UPI0018D398B5|nr:hypothetical protein [Stenotrophomonas sp. GD03680]MBH1591962.1 hypothetical protein [Stenotrophomonas maltophilia]MDH2022505.1 hypothetical protein [Stenotrophomonas sp. GD03680]HEL3748629.1 hypothetical protein [Stenotrophomonas maltophilia]HEL7729621.1 hypothetical protein [Stenotrophomonas maltophilia]
MKITNNHKGPLGLPDGTILPPGEATPIANWDALKGNAVVQGWLKGKILTAEGGKPSAPAQESLLGSNVLPANIELAEGVTVQLGEVVRRTHEASGLSVADWNALGKDDREARLAATVLELQAAVEAEAEAKKGEGTATGAAADAEKAKASGGTGTQNPPAADKDALLARAKELGIDAKGTWGVLKLQAAIADAEAKKGEG